MQAVTYGQQLRQNPKLLRLAEKATAYLDTILGEWRELVSATWDLTRDEQGRPRVTLNLRDEISDKTITFSEFEMGIDEYVRAVLNRLWGDLLKVRSDLQHQKVLDLVKALEGS